MAKMSEFYKEIDKFEMLMLEDYCKKYQNLKKFDWKKIEIGYMIEIRITKKRKPGLPSDTYIFQSVG